MEGEGGLPLKYFTKFQVKCCPFHFILDDRIKLKLSSALVEKWQMSWKFESAVTEQESKNARQSHEYFMNNASQQDSKKRIYLHL